MGIYGTWFFDINPEHGGALRLVRPDRQARDLGDILGFDDDIGLWTVPYVGEMEDRILVDFAEKRNHQGRFLRATWHSHPDRLEWEDGNTWYKCGVPPTHFVRELVSKFKVYRL